MWKNLLLNIEQEGVKTGEENSWWDARLSGKFIGEGIKAQALLLHFIIQGNWAHVDFAAELQSLLFNLWKKQSFMKLISGDDV